MNESKEWTRESVMELVGPTSNIGEIVDAMIIAHNAALATANSQLDDAGSHNAAADRELRELRQQLAKLKEGK